MGSMMDGQTALVTGASQGIGLATAQALLDRGASVCITSRKLEQLEAAAESLGAGDRVLTVAGHAGDEEHRRAAIAAAIEHFGSLDVLVNGVGINPYAGDLMDIDLDVARKTLDSNVLFALAWTQEAYRAWMGENGGAIVNLASASGLRPTPDLGIYCVSKAAMILLTEQLAYELAPKVRVNAVAPATVKTRFATKLWEAEADKAAELYPLGRIGEPADIASAIAYLASGEAGWITGQTLAIDGGLTFTTAASPPRH